MRNLWKRSLASILLLGTAGGAALGLAAGGDPPSLPALPAVNEPAPAVTDTTSQQPSVSLEWAGPPVVKVNQANEYSLFVRNTCGQPLQKVVVQVKVPENVAVQNTTPVSKIVEGIHLFELGTLPSKANQTIKFQLKQATKGELNCQAWVTFTGTSAMKALVKEPKLAVKIKAPEKVILGDKFTVEYTVENVGDYEAEKVALELRCFKAMSAQNVASVLKPGETRTLTAELLATEVSTSVGYEATASATEGLTASAKTTVQVMVPKLDVSVTGPTDVMIGRKAAYIVKVGNCGDVPLTGVIVRESLPAGFRVLGGETGPDGLQWAVGDLAVGQVKEFTFEGTPMQPGSLAFHATAEGSRGTKAMKSIQTAVDGIAALRMEMLDTVDPVEKGGETTYEIRVVNTGSKADANIVIECTLPKNFEFVNATGPTQSLEFTHKTVQGSVLNEMRKVRFDPIAELAPKTEAVFKIKVKAVGTGDARFKASMTSKHLTSPVTKEESTRVYGE
jgi:uncharacterized repeat protein (TIGR01451 family)